MCRNVLFDNVDHCSFCWLCYWAKCWIMQDMETMEPSWVVYVKIGMFNHHEYSKISILTVNQMGMDRLTVQQDMIVSFSFMSYPRDYLRKISADIHSLTQCPIYIWQSFDFGSATPQFILANKQSTSHRLIAHYRTVGNPCNLQPFSAGFILSVMKMFAATYSILTWS
jgi:hypothetical protein